MRGQDHLDAIARKEANEIPDFLRARMRQRQILVHQLHAKHPIRHLLNHPGFYGLVRTHGPFSVTATQCSKWAEKDPS